MIEMHHFVVGDLHHVIDASVDRPHHHRHVQTKRNRVVTVHDVTHAKFLFKGRQWPEGRFDFRLAAYIDSQDVKSRAIRQGGSHSTATAHAAAAHTTAA